MENLFLTESKELQDYKTNVFAFLQREGYMPRLDDDNNIVFKQAGETTVVIVSEPNAFGYYIQMFRPYFYGDIGSEEIEKIKSNINEVNRKQRIIKSYYDDSRRVVIISAEFWVNNSADFARLWDLFACGITEACSKITKF